MVRRERVLLLVAILAGLLFGAVLASEAQVTCYAVTPSGAGSENGSSWSNAYAGLPSTLTRGAIYYLADGNYGNHLSLTQADSGTETIELRKAQSYDYGQNSATCSNSSTIVTGWNASTMGSAQAVWNQSTTSPSSIVQISSDYWIINGNGNNAGTTEVGCGGVQASPPAAMTDPPPYPYECGIKIDDSTCTATTTDGCDGGSGVMHGGGQGITWESVEWKGQGLNSDDNNDSETYFWFASGGSLANDTMSHMYCHNASTTCFTVVSGGWTNGSFDHNYEWGVFDGSVNHGENIQLQGNNSDDVIHHNIFRDQQTNGDFVAVDEGTETGMAFYDNADFCSSGGTSTTCRHNDGVIGCFGPGSGNTNTCTGYLIYNNTFSFPSNCGGNLYLSGPMTVENNLYYNCASAGYTIESGSTGSATIDYNSYLASSQSAIGSHDVSCSSSCPSPFTLGTSVQLASENADWNNRVSLGSPYDTTDLYGNAFTTDRGAAQYVSSGLNPPANLSGTVTVGGSATLQ